MRVSTAVSLKECICSASVWKNYGETRKLVTSFADSAGNQRGEQIDSVIGKATFPVAKYPNTELTEHKQCSLLFRPVAKCGRVLKEQNRDRSVFFLIGNVNTLRGES